MNSHVKHGGDTRKWKWVDGKLINKYTGTSLNGNGRRVTRHPTEWILDYNSRIDYTLYVQPPYLGTQF